METTGLKLILGLYTVEIELVRKIWSSGSTDDGYKLCYHLHGKMCSIYEEFTQRFEEKIWRKVTEIVYILEYEKRKHMKTKTIQDITILKQRT
jgi:hypothetical protein